MQRTRGGYTIIEVLVVLAVALITFLAALIVFSGKQGKTEFSQAMRDAESRIQSAVNDVGVSRFPDASNFTCVIDASSKRPKMTDVPSGTGTNKHCIFLGKAIQIVTDGDPNTPDNLYSYTVLGRRAIDDGTTVTDFDNANPTSISTSTPGPGDPDLTEEYTILFGATVVSAKVDASPSETDLVGFYSSLQPTEPTAQGSQSLTAKGYLGFDTNAANPKSQVKSAIEGIMPFPIADIKTWTICIQSGTSNEFAQLIVNASLAGVTTKIKYTTGCS